MGKEILKMENVTYYYPAKSGNVEILENVDYCFETGKLYTVMGPSGSGKTTTLSLLEGLDVPKEGKVLFEGKDISQINGNLYRGQHIGIIFQSYNLFPYLNARENVEVSMEISGKREKKKEKACELLRKMGLKEEQYGRGIEQLSGGEQQRVAIARALATDAQVILADEPTGNLDKDTAEEIRDLFADIAHELGKCVIVVTHSQAFSQKADVVVELEEKQLKAVQVRG